MEPSLKISDTEYKTLSQCNKQETEKLLDTLYEKMSMAASLPHSTMMTQLEAFVQQVEQRLYFFDIGHIEDKSSKIRIRQRISLIEDD